jgi:hypothetical protein
MDVKEYEVLEGITLSQGRYQWLAFVDAAMKLRFL